MIRIVRNFTFYSTRLTKNPTQLCLNHFVETYDPTIEDSYRKQCVIDGRSCVLEVLDTTGQEEYTHLRDQWIRDGEGFIIVYSVTSRSSFTRVKRFHKQVQRVKESSAGESLVWDVEPNPAPIMLVGNNIDRVTEREVSSQEGHDLARELGCQFVEASAKTCVNVEKAFYDVVRTIRQQREPRSLQVKKLQAQLRRGKFNDGGQQ
jgi:GTPase KRas